MSSDSFPVQQDHPTWVQGFFDWGAIVAASAIAIAVSIIATTFGAAIGLSALSPYEGSKPLLFYSAVGLWMIWVTVSTFLVGGYVVGRMRRAASLERYAEADLRDGMHGLAVWGVVVIMGALLAAPIFSKAAKPVENLVKTIGSQVRYADQILRGQGDAKSNVPTANANTRSVIERIILFTPDGRFKEADRKYLVNVMATHTNWPPAEASQSLAAISQQMKEEFEKTRETADKARRIGVFIGFLTAATLAIGAAAAWSFARRGARDREGVRA